ncbi:MAG: hypothetical protein DRO43_03030 [Candidatus Hecatellales archaeon]|nr:MAG: hypothetical protein DRO43_03030 [Candidatus Hecatellales archaeon]
MSAGGQVSELVEGFRKLRLGALISIISVIIAFASLAVLFLTAGFAFPTVYPGQMYHMFAGTIITMMTVILVALALSIIAFIQWFMATGNLKRYNPDKFGIGRLGMLLQLIGVILIFIGSLSFVGVAFARGSNIAFFGALFGFMAIIILTAILALVGAILFAIMLMRLPEDPNVESGFKIAGILYLIGVILSIIPNIGIVGAILILVAAILIFTYSGSTLKRLEALPKT